MNEHAESSGPVVTGWRLKMGVGLFLLSIILPLAGIPAVATLGFSAKLTASVSAVLLFGAELLGILSIAVMGKPGYTYIKSRLSGFLRRYGQPAKVSALRYRVGLVMFCVPILFAWLSVYFSGFVPGFEHHPVVWALGGDILLLMSLIVLGGDFWDKIRALFVHNAKAKFKQS